jgi:hypothetical protein
VPPLTSASQACTRTVHTLYLVFQGRHALTCKCLYSFSKHYNKSGKIIRLNENLPMKPILLPHIQMLHVPRLTVLLITGSTSVPTSSRGTYLSHPSGPPFLLHCAQHVTLQLFSACLFLDETLRHWLTKLFSGDKR